MFLFQHFYVYNTRYAITHCNGVIKDSNKTHYEHAHMDMSEPAHMDALIAAMHIKYVKHSIYGT